MRNQKGFKIKPQIRKELDSNGDPIYNLVDLNTGEVYWSSPVFIYTKEVIETPAEGISVDASISYNPGGCFEYRGIDLETGEEVFQFENFRYLKGTNNIAEFLAICHGIMYLEKESNGVNIIYSDSLIAIKWIKAKNCRTSYLDDRNTLDMIYDCEDFLKETAFKYDIRFWNKKKWGEPPSDYGRK